MGDRLPCPSILAGKDGEEGFWKIHAIVELVRAGRVQLEGDWVVVAEGRRGADRQSRSNYKDPGRGGF